MCYCASIHAGFGAFPFGGPYCDLLPDFFEGPHKIPHNFSAQFHPEKSHQNARQRGRRSQGNADPQRAPSRASADGWWARLHFPCVLFCSRIKVYVPVGRVSRKYLATSSFQMKNACAIRLKASRLMGESIRKTFFRIPAFPAFLTWSCSLMLIPAPV